MGTFGGADVARYLRLARVVAGTMMRDVAGHLDHAGMDHQDYTHELVIHAWQKLDAWRASPRVSQGPKAEYKYVAKCVWNRARSFIRSRIFAARVRTWGSVADTAFVDATFEDRAICRQTLRLLRGRLSPVEWQILCQVAMAEGSFMRGSSRNEQRRRARAKKKARDVSRCLESCVY